MIVIIIIKKFDINVVYNNNIVRKNSQWLYNVKRYKSGRIIKKKLLLLDKNSQYFHSYTRDSHERRLRRFFSLPFDDACRQEGTSLMICVTRERDKV